jgi:predicted glycosyltransferase
MTFTDLNITKTPALVTPNEATSSEMYDVNNNIIATEEPFRADAYSKAGGCHWLTNNDLDADMLVEGIRQTNKIKEQDIPDINLDGGEYIKNIINSKIVYN